MRRFTWLPLALFFSLLLLTACNATPTPTARPPEGSPSQTPTPAPTKQPPVVTPTATLEPTSTEPEATEFTPTEISGSASLAGQVWDDVCGTRLDPGGSTVEASPGCLFVDGEYRGNGVREPSEPGLAGLSVSLAQGSCSDSSFTNVLTGPDGDFRFEDLPAGAYCLRIDPANLTNQDLLGAGWWTAGFNGSEGLSLDLSDGEQRTDLSFGWDFSDLPVLNASNCTEKAAFVSDVTIPDYTLLRPGESFQKAWKIKNDGSCTWDPAYQLIFVNGDPFNARQVIQFPSVVTPGGTVTLAVDMQAPGAGGSYRSNWQFRDSNGRQFGVGLPATSYLWAIINVTFVDENGDPVQTLEPGGSGSAGGSCPAVPDSSFESQVLGQINRERSAAGLPALSLNSLLSAAARVHSTDMACNDFDDHTGSDGSLWYGRIASQGYSYSYASENIYVGNPAFGGTPDGAVDWWMNSQVHRDNILSQAVSEIGIGYVYRENSTYGGYYTVDFARP